MMLFLKNGKNLWKKEKGKTCEGKPNGQWFDKIV
jgi:hypothetical protein